MICFTGITININGQVNFNVKRTLSETSHQIVFSAFNADGSFVITAGSDSSLIIWNYDRKTIHRTLSGLKARPNTAAFTPDNRYVISGGKDNIATMWDLTPMPSKVVKTYEGHKGPIKTLSISPDGRLLATGSEDKTVRVWNLQTTNLIYELKGHSKDVNSVAFSPDGKILASGGADGVINLWNTANGSNIANQTGHKGYLRDLAFNPEGKLLASCGDDKMIFLWQIPGLNKSGTLEGHKNWIQNIDFSPDGKNLISGGWDRTIILWDVQGQKPLIQSEKQKQIVVSLDISPSQPDFISSCYESENLETWILSGLDETQWKNSIELRTDETSVDNSEKITKKPTIEESVNNQIQVLDSPPEKPMIRIFSPPPVNGSIVHGKNSILLIGQVSDSGGINTFLINKKAVKLSDDGIFQYDLNLKKGENIVALTAINSNMRLEEQKLVIHCTAGDAFTGPDEVPDISKSRYYALLIGVDDYLDPNITDLDNPVRDAENLYNVLLKKYTFNKENISILRNPTLEQLTTSFEELAKTLSPNDNLLIFYAGHGYWDSKGNIGYWLPSDATRKSTVKWFRNSTLRDFISSIQAKHTMLIADACFSGAIFKTRAAFGDENQGIQKLYELPSRKAMTSGILQEVPDESMFIKYLVKKLDENEERYLSSELLFSSFKITVMNNSPNVPQFGVIQNVGDEGGDFIFIKR